MIETTTETYWNIKTKDYEDYALSEDELKDLIAMHTKDRAIYCIETITETIETNYEDDYFNHPTLTHAQRN